MKFVNLKMRMAVMVAIGCMAIVACKKVEDEPDPQTIKILRSGSGGLKSTSPGLEGAGTHDPN